MARPKKPDHEKCERLVMYVQPALRSKLALVGEELRRSSGLDVSDGVAARTLVERALQGGGGLSFDRAKVDAALVDIRSHIQDIWEHEPSVDHEVSKACGEMVRVLDRLRETLGMGEVL
jgi:hypothetical protein